MQAAPTATEISRILQALQNRDVPTARALRRAWSRRLAHHPAATVLALAGRLASLGDWERWTAYELIAHHPEAPRALRPRAVVALGRRLRGWGNVDGFACYIAGPAWRERRIPDALVRRWARSPDRWRRRLALVSTVPLNSRARGGSGDTERTVAICRMLVKDRDDMVVKALSWALRELSKRDRRAVQAFLREQDGVLAARVRREVRNKLNTGLKNPGRNV
jgi:hypothetical protein